MIINENPEILEMSNAEYHAHEAISSSAVKAACKSMAHWKHADKVTGSTIFDVGTGFHDMTLEGGHNTVEGPEKRVGNAWKEQYKQCQDEGKVLLTAGDYATVKKMAASCLENERVNAIIHHPDVKIEKSFFVTDPKSGLRLKARPDAYLQEKQVCLDLKSTVDAAPGDRGFQQQIFRYNYHIQAAFYKRVLELCGHPVTYFAFAAVEKTAPYAQCLHVLSGTVLNRAEEEMDNVLARMAQAIKEDHYPTDWPDLNMIHLPGYMEE